MKGMSSRPEAWLRGPVAGVPLALQPVAHALQQALEEVEQAMGGLTPEEVSASPGGAATIAFHVRHMAGSLDRLFTYARGEALSEAQRQALRAEQTFAATPTAADLAGHLRDGVERAIEQLRTTAPEGLDDARVVGRAQLPSTVRGLLHHAGEHAARHAGQIVTTARIVQGLRAARDEESQP
jgi:uncharacterized damage-inducible protein DinB